MKFERFMAILLAVTAPLLAVALLGAGSRAVAAQEQAGDAPLSVLLDTGPGMAAELDALARFWAEEMPPDGPLLGWPYADTVGPPFMTGSAALFGQWLDGVQTSDDGSCPDDLLRALAGAARLGDAPEPGQATALLVGEGAPSGRQRALLEVASRLVRSDIQLYQLLTDWCDDAPLRPRELAFLSQATGGVFFGHDIPGSPAEPAAMSRTLQMATRQALARTTILQQLGHVQASQPDDLTFPVDPNVGTITILGVETDEEESNPCLYILTWTVPVAVAAPLSFALRAPDGQVITPGSPGVDVVQAANRVQYQIDTTQADKAGLWQMRVAGDGQYFVRVDSHSDMAVDYMGRNALPANRPVLLPLALTAFDDEGKPFSFKDLQLGLRDGSGTWVQTLRNVPPGSLSQTGGWYWLTDTVTLPPGIYYPAVRGHLADDTPFTRMDPAPLRVLRFRVGDPTPAEARAGDSVVQSFEIANDANSPQSFLLGVGSESGWALTSTVPATLTIPAATTATVTVTVEIPADALPGTRDRTLLTAQGETGFYAVYSGEGEVSVAGSRVMLPLLRR